MSAMDKYELKELSTFLSPNIKKLFDSCRGVNNLKDERTLTVKTILKDWDLNSWHNDTKEKYNEEWFQKGLQHYTPLLSDLSQLEYSSCFQYFSLGWTKMEHELQKAANFLSSTDVAHYYIALLKISALTERILGKVILLVGKNVPFLLRDLLETTELNQLLGKALVDFFKLFIGSVHGLNLRNIAWHGFLSTNDVRREHSAILLFVLHKCGKVLRDKQLELLDFHSFGHEKILPSLKENMLHFELRERTALEIMTNSNLICNVTLPLWKEAYNLLKLRKSECLLLLLPLLENSLRQLYAMVNSCPSRILCATNSEFYITLDEIFSPWKNNNQNVKGFNSYSFKENCKETFHNLVPQLLGRQLTEAFYDIFHCINGPRLRDRISHGEVLPSEVPFKWIDHIFYLSLLVLSCERWRFSENRSLFTIKCGCESFIEKPFVGSCSLHYSWETEEILNKLHHLFDYSKLSPHNLYLISYIEFYETAYHPSAILKQSLERGLILTSKWKEWRRPKLEDVDEISWKEENMISGNYEWKHLMIRYKVRSLSEIEEIHSLTCTLVPNAIFSSKLQLEIFRTLQRIMASIIKSLTNIQSGLSMKYSLYSSKTLRSRQRETYFKQLNCVPEIVTHIFIIVQMVYFIFTFIGCWKCLQQEPCVPPFKALLKRVLKVVENLVSYTSSSVNNYHEALSKLKEISLDINCYFSLGSSFKN